MGVMWRFWLTAAAILFMVVSSTAQHLLQRSYIPSGTRSTVQACLEELQQQTHITLSYSSGSLDTRRRATLPARQLTVQEALDLLLKGTDVRIVEREDKILLVPADPGPAPAANRVLNGYLKDSLSREVLIGAVIYVPALNLSAVTNSYGFYSISLPAGSYQVVSAYAGYRPDTAVIAPENSGRHDVLLSPVALMTEVKVNNRRQERADHIHLTPADINGKPALLGETDVMRTLQHQPGVQGLQDGSSAIMVRGGDPGQNLHLLDGIPLYSIDHFYGLASVFNTDAIKSVDFYKDAYPARYGGRLSSVVDVFTKDGHMEHLGGQVNIGLLKSSLSLDGPLIKDKAAFMVTGRRTWADIIWRPFDPSVALDFYDLNAKVNYIINKNNRIYLTFFNGRDQFGVRNDPVDARIRWGSSMAGIKWTSVVHPKLFVHTSATYSAFRYETRSKIYDSNNPTVMDYYTGTSRIQDIAGRVQADWYAGTRHRAEFGIKYSQAFFRPVAVDYAESLQGAFADVVATPFQAGELVLYAEDEWKATDRWTLRAGLHWAAWQGKSFGYNSLQPRLYTRYLLKEGHSLYGAVTRMAQFLPLLTNNTMGFATDFWLPSNERIRPEEAWLYSLGYAGRYRQHLTYRLDVYYKEISGCVTYNSGAAVFDHAANWEDQIAQGRGWSYGAEVFLQERLQPFTLSVAYTLSKTMRQFDALNGGAAFPFRYDRRHNLHLDLEYQPRPHILATAGWLYMSGEAVTLPDQIVPDFDNNLTGSFGSGVPFTYNYPSWNSYRLPAIHRLDLAISFIKKRRRYYERTWSIGIYNAYGRKNIIGIMINYDDNNQARLEGTTLFRYIPTLSYRLKF